MTRSHVSAFAFGVITTAAAGCMASTIALAAEYLPLDLGVTRQYVGDEGGAETLVVTGTRTLFGTEVKVISYQNSTVNEGLENYWTTAPDGDVLLWGFYRNVEEFGRVYQPPVRMVDAPLSVGRQWATTFAIYTFPGYVVQGTATYPLEVYTEGPVSVPAGTYSAYGIGLGNPPLLAGHTITGEVVTGDIREDVATDWWSDGVGRVQYDLDRRYQLLSADPPTPTTGISWGRVKALSRTACR